ncbi:MAG: FAD-binding domain-containing protein [bacterium]|nr:FAD-binding domain-containing protein [bacterium]
MTLDLITEKNPSSNYSFPTNQKFIAERINQIDPILYGKTRNFIDGSVTYLSPYISRGVISGKQILENILQKGYRPNEIEKFIQELAWREYFQRIWQNIQDGIWDDIKQAQPDVKHTQMVESVINANTGVSAIDDAIEQLYANGYMHNHLRMYTASMVCNMAKAHWLQPSQWMYYHLLDGDIASNNCSWQWVAAAFASKKYYFNQENINKYTFSTQKNSYLDRPYEEIMAMEVPEPLRAKSNLSLQTTLPYTELPSINPSIPTLIYNSYNLDIEWHKDEQVNRILLLEPSHFKKYPVSKKVLAFIIDLAKNIEGIKLFCGEINEIIDSNAQSNIAISNIISKEHPSSNHYPGIKESRDWMFPEITGNYPSFFAYWKKCAKQLGIK